MNYNEKMGIIIQKMEQLRKTHEELELELRQLRSKHNIDYPCPK